MSHPSLWWWVGFNLAVLVMLAVDLGVFNRKSHEIGFWEAVWFSILWTALALLFNVGIWFGWVGDYAPQERHAVALSFLAGYLMERSLSFDNLFVFSVIFTYFAVPAKYQHRVLFYGIVGALIFRAIFIFGGLLLIHQFHWMLYVFAVFLIYTGIKLAVTKEREVQPDKNPVLRFVRRFLPISDRYIEGRFFARVDGRLVGTPLLLVLLFIETTDVVFALDSIPAIIGITTDPFIVYTSNVFAILGLRAIYFVLASLMKMFSYLNVGLAVLLVFIGGKMIVDAADLYHMPAWMSLTIICVILTIAIIASILRAQAAETPEPVAAAPAPSGESPHS